MSSKENSHNGYLGVKRLHSQLNYRILIAMVSLALLGCKPQTPNEKIKAYNDKLGTQAEYTGDYLIVRWPAMLEDKKMPAVTLKIPREYLDNTPVVKDEKGGISAVHLQFSASNGGPWQRILEPKVDSPGDIETAKLNSQDRVFVVIDRNSGGSYSALRENYRRRGQDIDRYRPDGKIGGLERYSTLFCLEPQSGKLQQDFVKQKMPDDPSPINCRLNRLFSILVSPEIVADDNEGVAVECMSTGCFVFFLAGTRGGSINIPHEDLSRWQEFVEPIRRRVDSFVTAN